MSRMTKVQQTEQNEAIARLREWVKPGDTVYTVLRHVSKTGMTRVIDIKVIRDGEMSHIGYNVALALGMPYDMSKEGVRIGGCGMDMGFQLVYLLGHALFERVEGADPGYSLKQRWV